MKIKLPKQEKDGSVKLTKQTTEWLKAKFVEHHRAIDAAETGRAISQKDYAISQKDYLQAQLIEDELGRRGIQVEIIERKIWDYKFTAKGKKTWESWP
jgi:hypothetical protein